MLVQHWDGSLARHQPPGSHAGPAPRTVTNATQLYQVLPLTACGREPGRWRLPGWLPGGGESSSLASWMRKEERALEAGQPTCRGSEEGMSIQVLAFPSNLNFSQLSSTESHQTWFTESSPSRCWVPCPPAAVVASSPGPL